VGPGIVILKFPYWVGADDARRFLLKGSGCYTKDGIQAPDRSRGGANAADPRAVCHADRQRICFLMNPIITRATGSSTWMALNKIEL
jgi:hypothetical protein